MTYTIALKDIEDCWNNFKEYVADHYNLTSRDINGHHKLFVELNYNWHAKLVKSQDENLLVFRTMSDALMFKLRWS